MPGDTMFIAGVDEVGVSALAGPIVAGACVFDADEVPRLLRGIKDSKKIKKRSGPKGVKEWYERVTRYCVSWSVGCVSAVEIDEINVRNARILAMARAVDSLCVKPFHIWVDGDLEITADIMQRAITHGDRKVWQIAAASIVAKYTRDSLMEDYHNCIPQYRCYEFDKNVGYRSPKHLRALDEHRLCPLHRRRFKDCRRVLLQGVHETSVRALPARNAVFQDRFLCPA